MRIIIENNGKLELIKMIYMEWITDKNDERIGWGVYANPFPIFGLNFQAINLI